MAAVSEPHDAPAIVIFAKELTAWREGAGLKKKPFADQLGYADSYVGQIELCKNIPSEDFAAALDTYFKTNGLFTRLRQRIIETRHATRLPPGFLDYVEKEAVADGLRIYCALLVVGLFQCESYATTIIGRHHAGNATELVAKRMDRRLILDRESPPQVFLVLDEGVLQRVVGGPGVMRDQLRFLYEISQHPKVQVQVIPYSAGYHVGLGGSLTILGFRDSPSIGYTESAGIGILVEQPGDVAELGVRYDLLRGHAADIETSRAMIKEAMESYERQAADQVAQEQP